jgi:hypothetical protein
MVCIVIFLLLPMSLHAATQGSRGNTSSGTVDINIVKDNMIVIKGLIDFNFGTWTLGDGTLTDNDNVCIGKSEIFVSYAIRAAGNGDGFDPAAFTLSNGTDQIYYNVYWNDATGTTGNVQLTPGVIMNGQTASFFTFFVNQFPAVCFNNANLAIEIPDTELSAANSGNYAGTLTLLVIPD